MEFLWNGAGGFIRAELNQYTRINVYSPDLPPSVPIERGAIHDHRYMMSSRVLTGTLEHVIYDTVAHPSGRHSIYYVINDRFEFIEHADIVERERVMITKGNDFRFGGPNWFHRVVPHGRTVTCVTRTSDVSNGEPCKVICLRDQEPVNAFDPEKTPSRFELQMRTFAALSSVTLPENL